MRLKMLYADFFGEDPDTGRITHPLMMQDSEWTKEELTLFLSGLHKSWMNRSAEEIASIARLEHRRWNAYMRSEGFCYSPRRNDLAKTHNLLIPFDKLTEDEKRKDA